MRVLVGAALVGLVTLTGCATGDEAATEVTPSEATTESASPEPTVALAPDTEVTPPLNEENQALDVITEGVAGSDSFDTCVQQYRELTQDLAPGGPVTLQLLEEWSDTYDDAAQSAAEADYGTAAQICNSLVAEMKSTIG